MQVVVMTTPKTIQKLNHFTFVNALAVCLGTNAHTFLYEKNSGGVLSLLNISSSDCALLISGKVVTVTHLIFFFQI